MGLIGGRQRIISPRCGMMERLRKQARTLGPDRQKLRAHHTTTAVDLPKLMIEMFHISNK